MFVQIDGEYIEGFDPSCFSLGGDVVQFIDRSPGDHLVSIDFTCHKFLIGIAPRISGTYVADSDGTLNVPFHYFPLLTTAGAEWSVSLLDVRGVYSTSYLGSQLDVIEKEFSYQVYYGGYAIIIGEVGYDPTVTTIEGYLGRAWDLMTDWAIRFGREASSVPRAVETTPALTRFEIIV